ncbi:ergothioneine biosynthesis glutamate--cysteine ligase EgtA [Spongiactinospora sp. TRM90649]|uniref:ergothioneine biosynthesis glutamate--cysteine ligase EgtA n=1 Tax=Spongiactinospora sp. TRM90649 TaxID=3031114 RepID=UPI0023F97547|nr:ergothioneine biosynthesis glutamate--cysteine ligase EgtA [Spongiactinospora sp. TRM90649]MDF5752125.1 ergothioneine biosynthesis glutamate--cysteine ligase EgtA [Spongiactinospora sp. TRM90649]
MTAPAIDDIPLHDTSDVEEFAHRCFDGGTEDGRIGVELEFLVFDREHTGSHVPIARVADALALPHGGAVLPGGSRVTFEPGGQLELSGPPGTLHEAIGRIGADVAVARAALGEAGLVLGEVGLDPVRQARRQLHQPRYDAMAEFFGVPYGALMMCSTASVQVNLDLGRRPEIRWDRAHRLGPVLTAAFANSPLSGGRPCGWMSGRQAVWEHLDNTRTAPVSEGADPVRAWTDYLLGARVMLRRGSPQAVADGSTFADWLASPGAPPTVADLACHATTVFPPVRPRGWLEIRYLDAQHAADWPVCVAVTHALIADDRAADIALDAAEPCRAQWRRAARDGLGDPEIRAAAEACFTAALEALPRLGASAELTARVAGFADRHVTPGRSPATDLLDGARAAVPA